MTKQIHILLADDDAEILRLFSGWFAEAGFEVLPAHDGNEAREMARRFQPDLILLDIHMPVLDGYKTAEYLKREKETSHIPVVFLTNEDLGIEAQKAWREIGVEAYIPKSTPHTEMIEKINAVLVQHGHELPHGAAPTAR
jgi:CheY-like chemotaxis protein